MRGRTEHDLETYSSATFDHLEMNRDKLRALSENKKFTRESRRLAAEEVEYIEEVLVFRRLPKPERVRLLRAGIAPWFNNWRREQ